MKIMGWLSIISGIIINIIGLVLLGIDLGGMFSNQLLYTTYHYAGYETVAPSPALVTGVSCIVLIIPFLILSLWTTISGIVLLKFAKKISK